MLKKILILNLAYIFSILAGFCDIGDKLSNIEYAKYGESYTYDSIAERLNRLETDFFGMAQSGDIESRIDMLSKMDKNQQQMFMQNPYNNFYAGKKKGIIRNFWDNVTSTFDTTGMMTGYTPSVTTYESGYNYPNNMYRNEFLNFMNNPSQYCPYHNRYHTNNHILNRPFHNNWDKINNRNINNHHYNNMNFPYNYNNAYNPYYNPNNGYTRRTYVNPPDITTRSSVHIIKD